MSVCVFILLFFSISPSFCLGSKCFYDTEESKTQSSLSVARLKFLEKNRLSAQLTRKNKTCVIECLKEILGDPSPRDVKKLQVLINDANKKIVSPEHPTRNESNRLSQIRLRNKKNI
jgi:hypothetical protein